jgi:hypothetical protein
LFHKSTAMLGIAAPRVNECTYENSPRYIRLMPLRPTSYN